MHNLKSKPNKTDKLCSLTDITDRNRRTETEHLNFASERREWAAAKIMRMLEI